MYKQMAVVLMAALTISGCSAESLGSAPSVSWTIDSPSNGQHVGIASVAVAGTAPSGTRIVQDIAMAADKDAVARNGRWSIMVSLKKGDNTLTFRVEDDKSTSRQWHITYDPSLTPSPASSHQATTSPVAHTPAASLTPPTPTRMSWTIDSPANGEQVGTASVAVAGTAPSGTRIVQDISMAPDSDAVADSGGHWSITVWLSPGDNTLTFRVGDDKSTARQLQLTYVPNLVSWGDFDNEANTAVVLFGSETTVLLRDLNFGDSMGYSERDSIQQDLQYIEADLLDWDSWARSHAPKTCFAGAYANYRKFLSDALVAIHQYEDDLDLLYINPHHNTPARQELDAAREAASAIAKNIAGPPSCAVN